MNAPFGIEYILDVHLDQLIGLRMCVSNHVNEYLICSERKIFTLFIHQGFLILPVQAALYCLRNHGLIHNGYLSFLQQVYNVFSILFPPLVSR